MVFVKAKFDFITTRVDKNFINSLPPRHLPEWRNLFLDHRDMDLYYHTQNLIDQYSKQPWNIGIDFTNN